MDRATSLVVSRWLCSVFSVPHESQHCKAPVPALLTKEMYLLMPAPR